MSSAVASTLISLVSIPLNSSLNRPVMKLCAALTMVTLCLSFPLHSKNVVSSTKQLKPSPYGIPQTSLQVLLSPSGTPQKSSHVVPFPPGTPQMSSGTVTTMLRTSYPTSNVPELALSAILSATLMSSSKALIAGVGAGLVAFSPPLAIAWSSTASSSPSTIVASAMSLGTSLLVLLNSFVHVV